MRKPASYCGVAEKPCEYHHAMNSSACVECRNMLILSAIEDLKQEIRKNE